MPSRLEQVPDTELLANHVIGFPAEDFRKVPHEQVDG